MLTVDAAGAVTLTETELDIARTVASIMALVYSQTADDPGPALAPNALLS